MGSDWKPTTIGEHFELVTGYAFKSKAFLSAGIPVIKIKNVKAGHFSDQQFSFVAPEFLEKLANKVAQPEDLLISMSGNRHDGSPATWVGKIAYFRKLGNYLINQRVGALRLKPDSDLDPRFMAYLLSSWHYQEFFISIATSSGGQANISPKQILGASFKFPSRTDQQSIAHILGTLDDKIELNQRMNRRLEAIARAIFKSWFIDFDPVIDNAILNGKPIPDEFAERADVRYEILTRSNRGEGVASYPHLFPDSFQDSPLGKIPKGWEARSLSDLCEKPQYGYTESAKDEPVGPHFLRIKDINKQPWIDWKFVPYCEIADGDFTKYRLKRGDIVVARIADPGHAAFVEQDVNAVFASYLIRFRLLDHRYGRYVQYWQKSEQYWDLVYARRSGSTRGNLNAKALSGFPVLVPPPLLTELFSQAVSPLRRRLVTNTAGAACLARVRDELLPRLLTGELLTERSEVEDRE